MNTLIEMFREGGFGMWPTLIFGLGALALAARHAVAPRGELMPLITGLGLASIFASVLGTVSGIIVTLRAVSQHQPESERATLIHVGTSESLMNVVLAAALLVLIALVASVGSYRAQVHAHAT